MTKRRIEILLVLLGGFAMGSMFSYLYHNQYLGYVPLYVYLGLTVTVWLVEWRQNRQVKEIQHDSTEEEAI
jgi:hypothetical protein